MFKVNNKDVRITSMTYFALFYSICIVEFEHASVFLGVRLELLQRSLSIYYITLHHYICIFFNLITMIKTETSIINYLLKTVSFAHTPDKTYKFPTLADHFIYVRRKIFHLHWVLNINENHRWSSDPGFSLSLIFINRHWILANFPDCISQVWSNWSLNDIKLSRIILTIVDFFV